MVQKTYQGEKACVKRHDDDDDDDDDDDGNMMMVIITIIIIIYPPGLPFSPVSIILVLHSCLRPSLYSIILTRDSVVKQHT